MCLVSSRSGIPGHANYFLCALPHPFSIFLFSALQPRKLISRISPLQLGQWEALAGAQRLAGDRGRGTRHPPLSTTCTGLAFGSGCILLLWSWLLSEKPCSMLQLWLTNSGDTVLSSHPCCSLLGALASCFGPSSLPILCEDPLYSSGCATLP